MTNETIDTVRSGTVVRDGWHLHWVREGGGVPLIVIRSVLWYRRYFPQALRDHFDIVFCDSRQWAPTPNGFDISTITNETVADDVEAIREAVGFERPLVMGQSQHGAMALEYARRYPSQVRGAVAVASGPPQTSTTSPEAVAAFIKRDLDPARRTVHEQNLATRRVPAAVETVEDFVDLYVANGALGWYDPTYDARWLWDGVEPNIPVMQQIVGPDVLGAYDLPLEVPVFVALGRYDYGLPYEFWDEARAKHPQLHYRLYERSAHNPPHEQPEEFTDDLVAWASQLAAA